MVKWRITSKVDSHHTNPNYKCLLADLLDDPTFHFEFEVNWEKKTIRLVKANWMPTDKDFLEGLLEWIQISPTAWELILENVKPAKYLYEYV
jgi:hypothetical protein